MTVNTLIGQLVTADGMARQKYWHQPAPEMIGPLQYRARPAQLRTDHFTVDRDRVRPVQPSWVAVTVGHSDDCLGHAEHLEQLHDGLWVVAEIYADPPPETPYLSPEWYDRSDGLEITAASLTARPAQILMQPVTVVPGRLRDCSTRGLPDRHTAMLQRARTAAKHRAYGEGIVVHDEDDDAPLELLPRRRAPETMPVGELWHRPCRILRIR